MMDIVLCTDAKYVMPCGTCIISIFENNKSHKLRIHILTPGLSDQDIAKFKQIEQKYGQQIVIHKIDDSAFASYPLTDRFPKSIYFRFLIPDILSDNNGRALYLDCDTIVLSDLGPLWEVDLGDKVCGAIEDQKGDEPSLKEKVGDGTYYNSGVLLMNLTPWRQKDASGKCFKILKEQPEKCLYPDQDAINIALQPYIYKLPYNFNLQEVFYFKRWFRKLAPEKWKSIKGAMAAPAIMHYCGDIKPWNQECRHPFRSYFRHFKSISPWAADSLTYYHSSFIGYGLKRKVQQVEYNYYVLKGGRIPYNYKFKKFLCTRICQRWFGHKL